MPALTSPLPNENCPLCGGPNSCGPARQGHFDTPCWCRTVHIPAARLQELPADARDRACLCPRCAATSAGSGN